MERSLLPPCAQNMNCTPRVRDSLSLTLQLKTVLCFSSHIKRYRPNHRRTYEEMRAIHAHVNGLHLFAAAQILTSKHPPLSTSLPPFWLSITPPEHSTVLASTHTSICPSRCLTGEWGESQTVICDSFSPRLLESSVCSWVLSLQHFFNLFYCRMPLLWKSLLSASRPINTSLTDYDDDTDSLY